MDHHHDRNHENNHDYDDDDVIAYIYPAVGTRGYLEAARSIDESAASPLYLSPRRRRHRVVEMPQSGPADIFARHKRERTVEEEEDDDEGQSHGDLDYEACIRVTFDSIPKTRYGLRVGRDSDAEFRVLDLPGVSAYHFALTFDANYRPIVRDLGSKYGTSVIYDDMERGRWRSFDWIVGGSDFLQKVNTIVVKVTKFLQFQLAIPRHDVDSKSYRDRVERFRAGVTDAEQVLDLGRLGPLSRVNTAAPSGARTPTSGPSRHVTAHKKLGTGGFGVVYHVWNVSTGEEYALKEPKKGSGHDAQWKREIVIMKRISHKHIVSLINSCLPPSPWLHLEYMPEGSISDHLHAGKSFDERECKQILAQSSDALAYLHSQDPRIVHRDVKPGNILILRRRPDDLFIKFADFGISREGDTLKTFCGTYAYLAPGVYKGKNITRRRRPTYTALVDVWSLGVVLARLLCGLPKQEEIDNTGVEWCESIRERVERALRQGHRQGQRQDLLSFVLESMLCLDPNDRETAAECHKEALRLLFNSNSVPESDNDRGEADGHHQHQQSDTEASTILAEKEDGSLSSLSRYINHTNELLERRWDRSCRAPSPETVIPLHAGQLLEKLRNPQDSLFCKSSFGKASDSDSGSDCSTSAPATVIIARDTVVEPQTQEQEDRPSNAPIREALVNFLNNGTGATLSVKRSRPASRSPGSKSPRVLSAGGADGGVGDGLSARTAKRNRTVRGAGLDGLTKSVVI
ncbi:hypothetical protein RB593_001642 [Gaeumannomyces tritici]